jgi:predicted dehydrogenase
MANHHARAIQRCQHATRIVAVADPAMPARQELAKLCPQASDFPSLEEAIRETNPDVVHVCSPPATHYALAGVALRAGCHVYVEKPFAETVAEAEELLAEAADRELGVCAGHQLLFERPSLELEEVLPALGTLVHLESYFSFRPTRRQGSQTLLTGDDQLLDVMPHPVYLLLHFLERVSPTGHTEVDTLDSGPGGTVHGTVRRGHVSGSLVVTLEGRPVESYLRLVGTNGSVTADYVRGIVLRSIGPGTSGIDKLLAPYRAARQLSIGTSLAMGNRILRRQRSYPGLVELFDAFYASLTSQAEPPVSSGNLVDTVKICERVAEKLRHGAVQRLALASGNVEPPPEDGPRVLVTGGTGFLGAALVKSLRARGAMVRIVTRRAPSSWEERPDVEYMTADLSTDLPEQALSDIDVVVHCAAATAGGWDEHQRHSLDATRNLIVRAG